MENSLVKYRLHSNAFERPEEDNPEYPKRVVFLSVEGAVTELQYFEHLKEHLKNSNTVFRIEVLHRKRSDGYSSPEHVIELLDEYVEMRDGDSELPESWRERLENKYSPEIINGLLTKAPKTKLSQTERDIYGELLIAGIDLQYRKYLKDIGNNDSRDIFAVVIDRDGGEGGRSRETIEACIAESVLKGYRFYLTNPCFDFWLLLHLCDVKTEYADKLTKILENKRISNEHTYVSYEVSHRAHHKKSISQNKFANEYLQNIAQAIEHAKDFATELADILDNLGTNLPDLLREFDY